MLAYNRIAKAYRAGNAADFNTAVAGYQQELAGAFQPELKKARQEQFFNHVEPFYKAMIIFVCAFLCVLGYWMEPQKWDWMRRTAVATARPAESAALPPLPAAATLPLGETVPPASEWRH